MKIYEIWEMIINESRVVQDMAFASLDGQLNVRFREIVDLEITKLCIVHEDMAGGFIGYWDLKLSDESWQELGFDKDFNLSLYRELILSIVTLRFATDDDYGNPSDSIDIAVNFKHPSPSKAATDLLGNICDKILESEFIDISDTSISNLKKNDRKLFLIRFP